MQTSKSAEFPSTANLWVHTTLAAMALRNINLQNSEAESFYHYSQCISPLEPLPARLSDMRETLFPEMSE